MPTISPSSATAQITIRFVRKSFVVIFLFCTHRTKDTPGNRSTIFWNEVEQAVEGVREPGVLLVFGAAANAEKEELLGERPRKFCEIQELILLATYSKLHRRMTDTRLNKSVVPKLEWIAVPFQRNGRMGPLLLSPITQLNFRCMTETTCQLELMCQSQFRGLNHSSDEERRFWTATKFRTPIKLPNSVL